MVQIVALSCALSDTSENTIATMFQCDVMNQFHDNHSFSNARSTKKTDLATFSIRRQKVHHLDTSEQLRSTCVHLSEYRCGSMDGICLVGLDRSQLIDGL